MRSPSSTPAKPTAQRSPYFIPAPQRYRSHHPAHEGVGEELVALWAQMLDTDSITSDTDFFRNGGDSLQILELLTAVEQPWDVDVPVEDSH